MSNLNVLIRWMDPNTNAPMIRSVSHLNENYSSTENAAFGYTGRFPLFRGSVGLWNAMVSVLLFKMRPMSGRVPRIHFRMQRAQHMLGEGEARCTPFKPPRFQGRVLPSCAPLPCKYWLLFKGTVWRTVSFTHIYYLPEMQWISRWMFGVHI